MEKFPRPGVYIFWNNDPRHTFSRTVDFDNYRLTFLIELFLMHKIIGFGQHLYALNSSKSFGY
jgi:hypothetical protein